VLAIGQCKTQRKQQKDMQKKWSHVVVNLEKGEAQMNGLRN
jgi:hypothetical protein